MEEKNKKNIRKSRKKNTDSNQRDRDKSLFFFFVYLFPCIKNIKFRDLDLWAWELKLDSGFRI